MPIVQRPLSFNPLFQRSILQDGESEIAFGLLYAVYYYHYYIKLWSYLHQLSVIPVQQRVVGRKLIGSWLTSIHSTIYGRQLVSEWSAFYDT